MKQAMRHALLLTFVLVTGASCSSGKADVASLDSITTPGGAGGTDGTGVVPIGGANLGTIPQSAVPSTEAASLPTTTTPLVTQGPPCTFNAIHASVGPAPAGATDIDLRCVGDWASWVGKPDDPTKSDGYFAVAQRTATGWKTVNLGTAGVCSDGRVPAELWTALNCTE